MGHNQQQALQRRGLQGCRPAIAVVVEAVAVLDEKAEDGQMVLSEVGHRDEQRAPWPVDAPGVVPFQIRLRRMRKERRTAYIFVNNRFEGNAPQTIQAVVDG